MDMKVGSSQPMGARWETLEPSHLWVLGVVPDDDRLPAPPRRFRPADVPECECPDFCLRDHENE